MVSSIISVVSDFIPLQSQTALLYASVNITDDQGKNGTMLQLNPSIPGGMYLGICARSFIFTEKSSLAKLHCPCYPDFQPVITACSLNFTNFPVMIDPASRNITTASLPPRVVQTTWQDWQAPPVSSDSLIASVRLSVL
jgi:hypothetical protein